MKLLGKKVVNRIITEGEPYVRVRLDDGSLVREHRFVMVQKLGRELERRDLVHHKDENKRNNHPDNLEILTVQKHNAEHSRGVTMADLMCATCSKAFRRDIRQVKCKMKIGQTLFYCSRKCQGKVNGNGKYTSRRSLSGRPTNRLS